jgi:hypothetical protein
VTTRKYAVILASLIVALVVAARVDTRANATATPTASTPASVETTLDVRPRDDDFPELTSTLTIRIPVDWPEAAALLAAPIDSASRTSALGDILVPLGLAYPDDSEGAVHDLFPGDPDIRVDGGILTISVHRTAELRDEGGADMGLWWIGLGPCAIVERTWPDPVLLPEEADVEGDEAGVIADESSVEEEPGPTLQVRFDQRCDLNLVLEIPGVISASDGSDPGAGPGSPHPQLIADVWFQGSGLVSAVPMPVLVENGHVRWSFTDGVPTSSVEARLAPPNWTRWRFRIVSGLSNLQPVGIYLGPAAVLISAFAFGSRLRSAAQDEMLVRDGIRLQLMMGATLLYLTAGIAAWYALLWQQDPLSDRGEDWLAALYFGVAALPYLAAGALAATAIWSLASRRWRRTILAAIAVLVVGVLWLMSLLAQNQATIDFEASTAVREHEILRWLPILIPLLTTGFVAFAIIRPAWVADSPAAAGARADERRAVQRSVSPHLTARPAQVAASHPDSRHDRRAALAVMLAVLTIVGSWLMFEWREVTGLGDAGPGVSRTDMFQGILTSPGLFYPFEFVSEAAAFMPLIALVLVWAAIRRTGIVARAERPAVSQDWVSMGLAVLFAAFVVGYGVAILGVQIPIAYLAALVVWWAGRKALTRWTGGANSQGGSGAVGPEERPRATPETGGAPEEWRLSWWENGLFAARWGAVLGIPMVALFMYVLITDEETRWFEQSPSFRVMKFVIVLANEAAVWVVAALVLGCLYTSLPGGRYGWVKGLSLALVFTLAEGTGLLARMLTGEDFGIEWLFRPLQVTLFLMALGIVMDARYTGWAGVWANATRPSVKDRGWFRRIPGVVGYLGPLVVTMVTVIQQILAGNATAALTEIISALPDLVSPLSRSA